MRQTHLTLGLGAAAIAAVLIAPRLHGMVVAEPVVEPPVVEVAQHEIIEVVQAQVAQPAPPPARPVKVTFPMMPLPKPADHVIPMKTGESPTSLIPELDQRPVIRHPIAHVPQPPPEPIDLDTWFDNCPACGMG